jgi:hypothetical protein
LSGKSPRHSWPSRADEEGRLAIVTDAGCGMRWTRCVMRRMTRSRTAKSCGSGAPTLAPKLVKTRSRLTGDGGKKARSPGRARISRNTIAQGRPDDRLVPVVQPRAFCLHADHGCGRHPAFPAPSVLGGRFIRITRTFHAARTKTHIHRHCERSEAIQSPAKTADETLDCFASLAMTEGRFSARDDNRPARCAYEIS